MGGWGDVAVMQGPVLSDLPCEEPRLLSDPFPPGTPLPPSGLDVCPQDLLTGLLFSLRQPNPLSNTSPMSSPSVPCGPLSPMALCPLWPSVPCGPLTPVALYPVWPSVLCGPLSFVALSQWYHRGGPPDNPFPSHFPSRFRAR